MVDRPVMFPIGILDDVRVKVVHIYIPIDFIIMDINEYPHVLIIVGRPFLCTVGTIIERGRLIMEVEDERINFIMSTMMEDPYTEVSCYLVEVEKPNA